MAPLEAREQHEQPINLTGTQNGRLESRLRSHVDSHASQLVVDRRNSGSRDTAARQLPEQAGGGTGGGAKRASLRFLVTCSTVGVQRHIALVRIDHPNATKLPGTQIMAVSVPVRPPPVPPPACPGSWCAAVSQELLFRRSTTSWLACESIWDRSRLSSRPF